MTQCPSSPNQSVDQIDHLTAQLSALRDAIDIQLIALKQQRNALLPVNRLPEELTNAIFQMIMDSTARNEWDSMLYKLCLVQARWWEQVVACCALWTQLHVDDGPDLRALKMARAQSALLTVDFGDDERRNSSWEFLSQVRSHSDRWKILRAAGQGVVQELGVYNFDAPELEELTLVSTEDFCELELKPCHHLRHVHLHGTGLAKWGVLKGLKYLHIQRVQVSTSFRTSLYDILSTSPELYLLHLSSIAETLSSSEVVESSGISDTLVLPRLRSLTMISVPFTISYQILQALQAPSLEIITISNQEGDGGDRVLRELVRQRSSAGSHLGRVHINSGVTFIEVQIYSAYLQVELFEHGFLKGHIHLALPRTEIIQTTLQPFLPLDNPVPSYALSLKFHDPPNFQSTPVSAVILFDLFPNVTQLEIGLGVERMADVIHWLSHPTEGGVWRWEQLKHIGILKVFVEDCDEEGEWETVMTMLSAMQRNRGDSGAVSSTRFWTAGF